MKEQPMSDEKPMGQVIQIDEARIRDHLGEMLRGTVEETLNAMLDAEADQLCALIEMYLAGISVRRVEDITEALWGTRVSPSTVSNLNKKIYAKIEAWRNRSVQETLLLRLPGHPLAE